MSRSEPSTRPSGALGPIRLQGVRQNNLDGFDTEIPRGSLTGITGVSGSGKSSLAFDTLFREGQRRFLETLSAYARQFVGRMEKPDVEHIDGLAPAIAVDQRSVPRGARSTVGTLTEVFDHLRVLFARAGVQHCPTCDAEITPKSPEAIIAALQALPAGTRLTVMGPRVRGEVGSLSALLRGMMEAGFVRARVDGAIVRIEDMAPLDAREPHDVDVVVDRIRTGPDKGDRLAEAARLAGQAKDLERYRSEFFGRMRELLGNQEGVRIQGDRFVFASEVLFATGSAELSREVLDYLEDVELTALRLSQLAGQLGRRGC